MPETVASKDGTRIACWRSGQGHPLVLVHGSMADHSRWDALRPRLEPHATVVAMDRRGRGGSGEASPYDVAREFEDVAAVVDAEARRAGGPVDLFGHSYGALCALEAARRTNNVRRLVLYEPIVLPSPESNGFADRADALIAEGRREAVVELLLRDILRLPEEDIAAMRAQPLWRVRVASAHTLAREDRAEAAYRFDPAGWRGLRVPTLLLLGSESPAFLRRSTEAIAAALPSARIAPLEGQQHMAIGTAPDLVAAAVLPFLAAPGARSPA